MLGSPVVKGPETASLYQCIVKLALQLYRTFASFGAVSPAVYNTKNGTCLNDPEPLALCESTSPRGWELSLVGDRVIACGRPFYAHPDIPVYDHTVTKKILHTSQGKYDIVWVDNRDLRCYRPLDKNELNRCVSDEKIPRHITQAWGEFKTSKKALWQQDLPNGIALAVTKNTVVLAQAHQVIALALDDGRQLWQKKSTASPVPWGLAVDHRRRVLLSLENGQVVCLGPTTPRVLQ